MTIYLDHAATSPVRREVLEAMWPFLTTEPANPSSRHTPGLRAQRALAAAVEEIAAVLGCRPGEVILTSGGTEADNLAVKGISLARPRGRHVVTTAVEHPAVLESCRSLERSGFAITRVPVDRDGIVDPAAATAAIREDTTLVSVQLANNEVGSVQPVADIAAAAARHRVPVHTDAVQAVGWLPVDLGELGVDAISVAGHKIGALRGTGVLAVRSRVPLEPLLHGGGQQRGRRSGTEDVAGAVGLATALRLAERDRSKAAEVAARRDRFVREVVAGVDGAQLTGSASRRLPNNASFCFRGVSGESLLVELDRRGIAVSSGSACAAGSDEPSPVLTAMGYEPELAGAALRVSIGVHTTEAELAAAAEALREAARAVRTLA
ncbi:MAG TPA: cysteine desulfurase family protein [Intrasporangium sp.]|uniref:cysteine desulfurase family protein n=1 Tax=Intrasporangium sp. TaxID=1925024 RepID=UPI002D76972B|nr:cysteine desulfurase family protein [Intrasporangium sp.]HET7397332.1 cysteine desulfurase family protein [Intrasporangium sp.]